MQSVLLITCAGGNSMWLSFVKGEFTKKVSLQERVEGNHTHFFSPSSYCTSAFSHQSVPVFIYQEENVTWMWI